MHKLLYVSSTRRGFQQDQLKAILRRAREDNAKLGVTGLLLYIDGGFLQVLEGERDTLHDLYSVIAADPRHWDAKLLLDEQTPRNFGDWSMGFKTLDDEASDAGLIGITQSAVNGLRSGDAKPILDVLIRTFHTVQGAQ